MRTLRATRAFEDLAAGDQFTDDGTSDRIGALVALGYLVEVATASGDNVDTGAPSTPAKGTKAAKDAQQD